MPELDGESVLEGLGDTVEERLLDGNPTVPERDAETCRERLRAVWESESDLDLDVLYVAEYPPEPLISDELLVVKLRESVGETVTVRDIEDSCELENDLECCRLSVPLFDLE